MATLEEIKAFFMPHLSRFETHVMSLQSTLDTRMHTLGDRMDKLTQEVCGFRGDMNETTLRHAIAKRLGQNFAEHFAILGIPGLVWCLTQKQVDDDSSRSMIESVPLECRSDVQLQTEHAETIVEYIFQNHLVHKLLRFALEDSNVGSSSDWGARYPIFRAQGPSDPDYDQKCDELTERIKQRIKYYNESIKSVQGPSAVRDVDAKSSNSEPDISGAAKSVPQAGASTTHCDRNASLALILEQLLKLINQPVAQRTVTLCGDGGIGIMALAMAVDENAFPFHMVELDCCGRTIVHAQQNTVAVEVGEIKSSASQASDGADHLDRCYRLMLVGVQALYGSRAKLIFTGYLFLPTSERLHTVPATSSDWHLVVHYL